MKKSTAALLLDPVQVQVCDSYETISCVMLADSASGLGARSRLSFLPFSLASPPALVVVLVVALSTTHSQQH